jgi:PPP family 3-phenylpropionic acid transporter
MTLRLSIFYAAVFLFIGVLLPFWPVWLKSRGMEAAEIGVLLSLGMWVRAVSGPLVAQAADRSGARRGFMVVLGWATLGAYALFATASGFWGLAAVGILAALCFSPMLPLADTITMHKVGETGLDYGRVRLWGSLSFIVAATGGGMVLAGRPDSLILWLILGTLAVMALVTHAMPEARPKAPAADTAAEAAGEAIKRRVPIFEVLADRQYLAFLAAASLIQASHAVYYGFATLHWRAGGLADWVIGALWAEGVIAEVALFAVSGRAVAKFGPLGLLGLAAVAGIVRWSVLGFGMSLTTLVMVQWLHAFTFGATHLAMMHFIAHRVRPEHAATAQSLYSSTAMGIVMGIAMTAAGWLYARHGGNAFFAMIALSAAGGLIALGLARAAGKR